MTCITSKQIIESCQGMTGNKKANLEEGWLDKALDSDLALSGVLEQHIDALSLGCKTRLLIKDKIKKGCRRDIPLRLR